MRVAMLLILAAVCAAQAPPSGSIAGVVTARGTGEPVAEVPVMTFINARWSNGTIFMSAESKDVRVFTDAHGRYKLGDLPPGTYRVSVRAKDSFTASGEKTVTLGAGQDVTIDFSVPQHGVITGRVIDQNKEPVPNARVSLVSKAYGAGGVGYYVRNIAMADDQGQYTMQRVEAGQPYLLAAQKSGHATSGFGRAGESEAAETGVRADLLSEFAGARRRIAGHAAERRATRGHGPGVVARALLLRGGCARIGHGAGRGALLDRGE